MTALVWDTIGERIYQTGVDRGVLYLHDGTVAVWNGITDVEESPDLELRSFFLDGVKFLENLIPGDYIGRLKAITYPDEFDSVNGVRSFSPGLDYYNQPPKSFNLSYRTKIGNDIDGLEHGYKIHILYNVLANPDSFSFDTLKDTNQPIEFGWVLTGTPRTLEGIRSTAHVSINSLTTPPDVLEDIENMLYGTESTEPTLPSFVEISIAFGYLGSLRIIDNGDGTWTATDVGTEYFPAFISMLDATTFQIDHADATYLDPDTYEIEDTAVGWGP